MAITWRVATILFLLFATTVASALGNTHGVVGNGTLLPSGCTAAYKLALEGKGPDKYTEDGLFVAWSVQTAPNSCRFIDSGNAREFSSGAFLGLQGGCFLESVAGSICFSNGRASTIPGLVTYDVAMKEPSSAIDLRGVVDLAFH